MFIREKVLPFTFMVLGYYTHSVIASSPFILMENKEGYNNRYKN